MSERPSARAREQPPNVHPATGTSAYARAPGGIGNIGPGLDILGCAVTGACDAVRATVTPSPGLRIDDPGHADLTRDPTKHAAGIAAAEVLRRTGLADVGIALEVTKGLPLAGGQGGSAASAIAGALAANAVLGAPLREMELLSAALVAEERLAGRHLDNLAPALLGGIILVRSIDPPEVLRLPTPPALRVVLVRPEMRLRTADARAVLPATVDLRTALAQAAAVAAMVAAFCTGDLTLLRGAIDDRIAEPARGPLLPGFAEAKQGALDAGALGCSISGGGPSAFAMVEGDAAAGQVLTAMIEGYASMGVRATGRVAGIDQEGARVEVTPRGDTA